MVQAYSMETSVRQISSLETWELQSLTLGIRNNVMIKAPKIKNWHSFVVAFAWKATIRE